MDHKNDPKKPSGGRVITRRGFLTTMGAGAVGVAAAGKIMAAPPNPTGTPVVQPDEAVKATLRINGRHYSVLVEPRWTLLDVLRDKIGLTGTKAGCGRGECGACTVLIDDLPRYSCRTLALEAQHTDITTVEGLMSGEQLGPVQSAFVDADAFQCGYCTPGQIMAVEGLLRRYPQPSLAQIQTGVSGNLCRCGAYPHIFEAARKAAGLKVQK